MSGREMKRLKRKAREILALEYKNVADDIGAQINALRFWERVFICWLIMKREFKTK